MASAQPKPDFERLWAGLGSNRELAVPDGHTDDGSKNGSKSACNAQTGNSSRMKEALFPGLSEERMMGLEPTTFCMANGSWVRPICGAKPHDCAENRRVLRRAAAVENMLIC